MDIFVLLSFLSSLIPLLVIIGVVKSVSSALLNPKQGKKGDFMSKYQEFMKEVNQEKDRLRNVPDKKENTKKEVSRTNQKTASSAQQRNNPYLSTNKDQYQQPKVKAQPLAERNRIQADSEYEAITRSYSNAPGPVKHFVPSKKQSSKRKKQTKGQKNLLEGIIYKEILDKPRALRPYR